MKVTELLEATDDQTDNEKNMQFVKVHAFVPRPVAGDVGALVDPKAMSPAMKERLAKAKAKQAKETSMGAFTEKLKAVAAKHGVKVTAKTYGKEFADIYISGKRVRVIDFVQDYVMMPDAGREAAIKHVEQNIE